MLHEELLDQVQHLKTELEKVEARLMQDELPAPVREDLEEAVDHIRLTLLGILHSSGEDKYEASAAIIRSRLERAGDLCRQVVADIDARRVAADSPELKSLDDSLSGALSRIHQLYKSGR
ncbi:MAG: hypothetical protein L0212_12350 [Acidobacteria bacterium]|nr:hypothetical protein [Acidobacteriota bacterium]